MRSICFFIPDLNNRELNRSLPVLTALAVFSPHCIAQTPPAEDSPLPLAERIWVSVQANIITQLHPAFRARYSGPNSLRPESERATSRVFTLYTGLRLTRTTEVLFDLESAGGRGISDAFGLAGFTNLDVVRNPTLGQAPYVARIQIHQTIPFSSARRQAEPGPLSLASQVPVRRLEIRAGKLGTVDLFDLNAIGSDSHLQFMNWTADNNGAYDYAADTRGYTYGVVIEYFDKSWAARFGEMLMPKIANGIHLDWNLARARGENLELEAHPTLLPGHDTTVRFLAYANHANMGLYREAIAAYRAGIDAVPDITAHRRQGRVKYGFGLNAEQELPGAWRVYGRMGWNEGHHESFAYTEAEGALAGGADVKGAHWKRPLDRAGATLLLNSLSHDHRRYLALGGLGFLLGDGALHYGCEKTIEAYYTAHLWRGVFLSTDLQRIWNPGYNRDRGPVLVPGFRVHVEDRLPFNWLRRKPRPN
jgi:high affinity Mn2+ porin